MDLKRQEIVKRIGNVGIWIVAIGIVLLMAVSFIISAKHIEMNPDVTYYTGVSKQILAGNIPYVDVKVDYTPLALYMTTIPVGIWGNSWTMIIGFMYFVLFIAAAIEGLIVYYYTKNKALSVLGGGLLLLYAFMSEGVYFGLEAFVLLFGLCAFYTLITYKSRWQIAISGILCACAFGSKQYGLGFAGICGLWILMQREIAWKEKGIQVATLVGGFFGTIVIFVGYFILKGMQVGQLAPLIFGEGYGSYGAQGIVENGIWMFKRFPILLAALAVIPFMQQEKRDWKVIVCSIIGICGFLLQCYFRSFLHYLILVWPFAILLTLYVVDAISHKYLKIGMYVLLLVFVLRMVPRVVRMDRSIYNRTDRWEQMDVAKVMEDYVPKYSKKVYAYKPEMLYCQFYNDYTPPLMKKYGYNAGFYSVDSISMDLVANAEYVLIPISHQADTAITCTSLQKLLSHNFEREEIIDKDNTIAIVYTRKQ
jgi:hypothetical protein